MHCNFASLLLYRRKQKSSRLSGGGGHTDRAYMSLDDTDSSDYPLVTGKSMRKMVNSENAVQIAKRYLRKHAKSLKVCNLFGMLM